MIEIVFGDGRIVHYANVLSLRRAELSSLATRRCERCGAYFTGPGPIIRGNYGQTVIVCARCKETQP
jgi:hypothetical protein